MKKLKLEDLIEKIKEYNSDEVETIKKAYYFAEELHKGQVRQSGEPYISHPLNEKFKDYICNPKTNMYKIFTYNSIWT